jgi:hypothetical protein
MITKDCALTLFLCTTLQTMAMAAEDSVTLRWKFPANASRNFTYEVEQKSGEGEMGMQVHITQTVVEKVTQSGTNSGTLSETVKSTKLKSHGLLGDTNFDSATSDKDAVASDPLAAPYAAMTGKTVGMQMTELGEVKSVSGIEAMTADMGPMGPMLGESLGNTFRGYGILLPEKALKVGDSWNQTREMKTPLGTVTSHTVYFYRGMAKYKGHDCAKIKKVIVTGGDLLKQMDEISKTVDKMADVAADLEKQIRQAAKLPEGEPGVTASPSSSEQFPSQGVLYFDVAGGYMVESTIVSIQGSTFSKSVRTLTE